MGYCEECLSAQTNKRYAFLVGGQIAKHYSLDEPIPIGALACYVLGLPLLAHDDTELRFTNRLLCNECAGEFISAN